MKRIYLLIILTVIFQTACYSATTETLNVNRIRVKTDTNVNSANGGTQSNANLPVKLSSKNVKTDERINRKLFQAIIDDNLGGVIAAIEQGANVNATSDFEKIGKNITPLNLAVSQDEEMVDVLLENGADPNKFSDFYVGSTEDTHAVTSLRRAAAIGKISVVKMLLKRGASVNIQNKHGDTPLMSAVSHTDILKLFLENGANVNQADSEGVTPLMAVVSGARYDKTKAERIKLLLEKGADLGVKNKNGQTALDIARSYGDAQIIKLLGNKNQSVRIYYPLKLAEFNVINFTL